MSENKMAYEGSPDTTQKLAGPGVGPDTTQKLEVPPTAPAPEPVEEPVVEADPVNEGEAFEPGPVNEGEAFEPGPVDEAEQEAAENADLAEYEKSLAAFEEGKLLDEVEEVEVDGDGEEPVE